MLAMFNGKPIFGPRGPAGPDGNPIGTVISYMGTKAPTGYLICDGSVYNISDYYKLAEFFKTQFGSESYFGGDGTTTFAVPDMRNLFLRGFHGNSEEQLSGNVGVKQEGTLVPDFSINTLGQIVTFNSNDDVMIDNADYKTQTVAGMSYWISVLAKSAGEGRKKFMARPVNMAVLYCIKATEAQVEKPVSKTVLLSSSGWIGGTQTVRVPGVFSDEAAQLIQPVPATSSQSAYYAAGIKCTGQAANSLTFTADIPPAEDILVYIVIQEVVI